MHSRRRLQRATSDGVPNYASLRPAEEATKCPSLFLMGGCTGTGPNVKWIRNWVTSHVKHCQERFSFDMPSDLWRSRVTKFKSKFTDFYVKVLLSFFCLLVLLYIMLAVFRATATMLWWNKDIWCPDKCRQPEQQESVATCRSWRRLRSANKLPPFPRIFAKTTDSKTLFLLFFEQFAVCVLVLLNVKHLILLRKVKFCRNLLHSCTTVLSDVFFVYLLNTFRNDCVLQTIFMPKSDATRSVWCAFENYVVLWYMLYISVSVCLYCLCFGE